MKRPFFIFGAVLAAVFAVAGVLYFIGAMNPQAPEAPANTIPPEEMRNPDEIVVEDNRFTDTREHYSGIIPEGWEIRKPQNVKEGIDLFDQDFLKKGEGCKISSGFLVTEENSEQILKQTEEDLKYQTIREYTVTDIVIDNKSGKQAVLNTHETGYSKVIYVDTPRGVFETVLFAGIQDPKLCLEQFSNFLDSLVIND